MTGPKEKIERSLGEALHLKGERCSSPKCAMIRKPYRPGMHGQKRKRGQLSDFGIQLREKRKFKVVYGLDEKMLRHLFERSEGEAGGTGVRLLELLERRLDNTIFRMGFAPSRGAARQLVTHGHVMVNKKRVRAPGYEVKSNDIISIRPESLPRPRFMKMKEELAEKSASGQETPSWLHVDPKTLEGKVLSSPVDVETPFDINILVESFSK